MSTIVQRRPITKALAAMLHASMLATFNIPTPFGENGAPDPLPTDIGYGIVYPISPTQFPAPRFDGSNPMAMLIYQVTSVGIGPDQAEDLADHVRTIMTDANTYPLLVVGQSMGLREPNGGPGTPMKDPNSPLVSIAERFSIYTSI